MKDTTMLRTLTVIALFTLATPAMTLASPQTPKPVTIEQTQTGTATIVAIDQAARSITLRYQNGDEDTFTIGPEVKRFDQLKKGDTIRATYTESVVFEVRQPGAAAPAAAGAVAAGRLKDTPGGVIGAVQTATVTVKEVDAAAGSITVTTADGHTMRRVVRNKQNLDSVKVGDKIDITYAQAVLLNAEPGK
jgi:Cu/Ag efflux protein CusF